jgi:Fur family ferric uptake transcriptional regulator
MHHARETLRREGYRLTPQRTLIWEVVRGGGHMTAEEIAAQVQARLPDVNLSTVYRTLELLVSLDLVGETRLGTTRTYYEVAPEPVHHHFVCESCGSVGHFSDRLLDDLYAALRADEGFAPSAARATVFGLCEECRRRTAGAAEGDAHP